MWTRVCLPSKPMSHLTTSVLSGPSTTAHKGLSSCAVLGYRNGPPQGQSLATTEHHVKYKILSKLYYDPRGQRRRGKKSKRERAEGLALKLQALSSQSELEGKALLPVNSGYPHSLREDSQGSPGEPVIPISLAEVKAVELRTESRRGWRPFRMEVSTDCQIDPMVNLRGC